MQRSVGGSDQVAARATGTDGPPASGHTAGEGWHGLRPADIRHNFLTNLADNALFWFGYSLIAPATMLSLYVSYLTESNLLISLVPGMAGLGWALPQLLAARQIAAMPIKKWFVVWTNIPGRVALALLALVTLLVAGPSPAVALPLTFLLVFLYRLSSGLSTPGYSDMLAKSIPPRIRGRWTGLAQCIGGALGAVSLVVARGILERYPFPLNFAICFGAATVIISAGIGFLAWVREPPTTDVRPAPPLRAYLASLPGILRADHHYARYLVARLLLMLSTMAVPFLGVYAVRHWEVEAGEVALYTSAMLAAQTLATLGWGWLLDRAGSKRVMELAGLAGALAAVTALLAPAPPVFALAYALVGVSTGAYAVSDGMIVIEFAPPHDRPRYVGLTNTALAPFQFLSPLIGGLLADRFGYLSTFGVAGALGLLGCLVLWRFVAAPHRRRLVVAAGSPD